MAHLEEVDYRSEEVKSMAPPGFGRHGGVQQHVVKQEKFEEVDQVPASRAGGHRGHVEARETKFEEDVNTRTGEFHERKENVLVKAESG